MAVQQFPTFFESNLNPHLTVKQTTRHCQNFKSHVTNIYEYAYRNYFTHTCLFILEKAMAPHSSTLAWKVPWMEEPGRLLSMRSLRLGHD